MTTKHLELETLTELATAMVAVQRGHPALAWLTRSLDALSAAEAPEGAPLRLAMARSGRQLGDEALALSGVETSHAFLTSGAWRLVDLGRAALVRRAFEGLPAARVVEGYGRLLRGGGLSEQQSLLRTLPLLPHGEQLVELAIEASRTNVTPVFAALALDNPFPAARFPALNFNQLVLKAVFLGLPVARVVGLPARATDELARMVRGYASERAAASRSEPPGVQYVLSLSNQRAAARL